MICDAIVSCAFSRYEENIVMTYVKCAKVRIASTRAFMLQDCLKM